MLVLLTTGFIIWRRKSAQYHYLWRCWIGDEEHANHLSTGSRGRRTCRPSAGYTDSRECLIQNESSKYEGRVHDLILGRARLPSNQPFMHVDELNVHVTWHRKMVVLRLSRPSSWSTVRKVTKRLKYVRYGKTGDTSEDGNVCSMSLVLGLGSRMVTAQAPRVAKLSMAMVLRLYTTACYISINNPLRGIDFQPRGFDLTPPNKSRPLSKKQPHPFPSRYTY